MTDRTVPNLATDVRKHRSSADYIDRTIATVRNHRDADNCWPQWANIFADEIEDLRVDVAALAQENNRLREERDALVGCVEGVPIRAGMIGARSDAPSRERPSQDSSLPQEADEQFPAPNPSSSSRLHSSKRVKPGRQPGAATMNALDVLRDHERFMWGDDPYKDKKANAREFDDALARVKAVVEAARATFPPECPDEDCSHASCNLARKLAALDGPTEEQT